MTSRFDIEACRALLRGGSRTFFAASRVLPRRVSEPAIALYAFCRLADDAVDLEGGKVAAVARLRQRLAMVYAGTPMPVAADRAFTEVVSRFAIPFELPAALLEGLAWDADARRYETIDDLIAYAVRVAGSVGAMMALLMRRRAPAVVARACDLGIAMQLTNIARDIGEDAHAGRLYIPLQWMREAGINPDVWLRDARFDAAIAGMVGRLLETADLFYARALDGIGRLPWSCRPGIHAARLIYAEIGREIERGGLDSVSHRAVVSASRKLALLAHAFLLSPSTAGAGQYPVEIEARFLVEAVAASPSPRDSRTAAHRRTAIEQAVWVLQLFERLERRDQLLRSGQSS